jgi:hypothetical protein
LEEEDVRNFVTALHVSCSLDRRSRAAIPSTNFVSATAIMGGYQIAFLLLCHVSPAPGDADCVLFPLLKSVENDSDGFRRSTSMA